MAFTYEPSTVAGRVRLLIPDTSSDKAIFSDAEIGAFLDINENNPFLAAATALETIASNTAMVLRVMTVLGTSTDGAKVSDALLKRAAILRKMAAEQKEATGSDEYVGVATAAVDQFTWMELTR